MRKTKEQKAITLIALIITIVVLLILAVVAINAVTGDGIIQHAVNAKEDYEQAQDEEQDMLAYYEQYLQTEGKSGDWIQEKTIVKNVRTGKEIEVGKKVNYDANGYSWYVLGAENGYLLLTTNANITTATLQGITAGWSTEEYRFVGAENALHNACKEVITDLGPATSVRSIKIEDINRITGYNPLKQKDGTRYGEGIEGNGCEYGSKLTYTTEKDGEGKVVGMNVSYLKINGEETNLGTADKNCMHPDGRIIIPDAEWENLTDKIGLKREDIIEIKNNTYTYYGQEYLTDTSDAYKLLFMGNNYFLASSNSGGFTSYGHVNFRMFIVAIAEAKENTGISYVDLWSTRKEDKKTREKTNGVRPVVYMPSDYEPVVE